MSASLLAVPAVGSEKKLGATGKPPLPWYVRAMLTHMVTRTGMDKRGYPHGLRHTPPSLTEEFTVSEIQQQLGRSSFNTTAVYLSHISPSAGVAKIRNRRAALWPALELTLSDPHRRTTAAGPVNRLP